MIVMKARDVLLLPLGVFCTLPEAAALICLVFWLTDSWPSNGVFQICLWSASLLLYFHHKYIKQNTLF